MADNWRLFMLDPYALARIKAAIRSGDTRYDAALARLARETERARAVRPVSVTEKSQTPPSGDTHDYMSLAPYWWPDPATPNGLPYLRRDGERNPELAAIPDRSSLATMTSAVITLALAFYYTGNEEAATHAALLLRTWFLHPATRMNPNLEYAQAIKGRNTGRGIGMIETAVFGDLVDSIGLLAGSRAWSTVNQQGMHDWFARFLYWARTSTHGIEEAGAANNHGSWYAVQTAAMALFVGETALATEILAAVPDRIRGQITPDGNQPLETARTRSWHYSQFNLLALGKLAALGERVGMDLWRYRPPEGGGIRAALEYLTGYASAPDRWPYEEISAWENGQLIEMLYQAAGAYAHDEYLHQAVRLAGADVWGGRYVLRYALPGDVTKARP
ncbi:MAG: alginate lyase family protein [Thermomicrobiales bacterium]